MGNDFRFDEAVAGRGDDAGRNHVLPLSDRLPRAETVQADFQTARKLAGRSAIRGGRPHGRLALFSDREHVALLLATAPILTVLLSRLWLCRSERIGRPLAAGSVLALAGVALVVFNGSFILKIQPAGDLLTLAAALTWALYNICLKKLDGRHSTLEITRKVFFYGVVTLLPVFAFTPLRFDTALFRNPVVAGNLLFLGLVASLFCFAVWNTAVKHLGTVKTSNYIYLVPLVALISSAIVLNERITPVALGGAVLILGGVYIAENGRHIRGLKPIHR